MRAPHRLATLVLTLVLAVPAVAQVPRTAPARPDPHDPDAVIVDELVVTARERGPAWWTVSNGSSTVQVMGVPTLAPKHMQWDRTGFERRLEGATAVILPYQDVHVRLATSLGAAWYYLRLRSGTPFEDTLDPVARARFVAARKTVGEPARRYATKNPLAAGLLLLTDYRDRNHLTNTDPIKLVKILAHDAKVPIRQKSYDIAPQLGRIIRTPEADGRACLDQVMSQVEAGPGVTLAAAKAWAEGDVRGALGNERTYERCIALVPGAEAFDDRTKADEVSEIEQALKTPGHAIALIRLRPLLSQDGVLERLRAAGYVVKTPGEED